MLGLIWASAWATKTNWQSGLIFMMLLMILVIGFDADDDDGGDNMMNADEDADGDSSGDRKLWIDNDLLRKEETNTAWRSSEDTKPEITGLSFVLLLNYF